MSERLRGTGRRAAAVAGLAACVLTAGCSSGAGAPTPGRFATAAPSRDLPMTRAERTGYLETSRYADVVAFLDSLRALRAPLAFGSIGKTYEGREIPYVIASRPLVRTPAEARATGKPIVYVQGNIHAGEVEGKEALLALLRDLTFATRPNVLDSIVLIAVPIYNADGNERVGPQSRQRTEQNGPELVGQRANAQGLDLNRDYVKVEAPETRASLAMFNAWDPDVFVDLHTTDGSFHGYALTYSPSLNPAAQFGEYTRVLLAELRRRVRERAGYETFDYGNFSDAFGNEVSTDTVHSGWFTYDHRPRFGTNYYGLRQGIAILSEAYSHDPFERRVKSTYAFVAQLLSLVAERDRELLRQTRAPSLAHRGHIHDAIAFRAALPKSAASQPVTFEVLARTGDSSLTQPGVPRGLRRTGELRTRMMPVFDRFVPTIMRPLPAYYAVAVGDTAVIAALRRHGVVMTADVDPNALFSEFVVDSVVRSPRPFQGHNEVRIAGRWHRLTAPPRSGLVFVPTDQRLGRVAAYLLDPESDDSFITWNAFDAVLDPGRAYPVLQASSP